MGRRSSVVAAAAAALLLAGCSGGDPAPETSAVASPAPVSPSATSAAPTPDTGIPADASPLSGRAGGAGKPVLVVKIDNTTAAQPHAGLQDADVVYVEEVEWGLTRLAAVFSTELPKVVGPVRSARISDLELLGQYGRPAFAFSGSQRKMHPLIARAKLFELSPDYGTAGFYRVSDRRSPWNEMASPAALLKQAPKASAAKDIGFRFDVNVPAGGTAAKSVTAPYPASQAKFVWNAENGQYDVWLNKAAARSAAGGTQHASTVVIQYVKQYDSGFGDKFGGRTPKEDTIGSGRALVLRDGQVYKVRWKRPSMARGTTFTLPGGQVLTFAPGQVWVALVDKKRKATVS